MSDEFRFAQFARVLEEDVLVVLGDPLFDDQEGSVVLGVLLARGNQLQGIRLERARRCGMRWERLTRRGICDVLDSRRGFETYWVIVPWQLVQI